MGVCDRSATAVCRAVPHVGVVCVLCHLESHVCAVRVKMRAQSCSVDCVGARGRVALLFVFSQTPIHKNLIMRRRTKPKRMAYCYSRILYPPGLALLGPIALQLYNKAVCIARKVLASGERPRSDSFRTCVSHPKANA